MLFTEFDFFLFHIVFLKFATLRRYLGRAQGKLNFQRIYVVCSLEIFSKSAQPLSILKMGKSIRPGKSLHYCYQVQLSEVDPILQNILCLLFECGYLLTFTLFNLFSFFLDRFSYNIQVKSSISFGRSFNDRFLLQFLVKTLAIFISLLATLYLC